MMEKLWVVLTVALTGAHFGQGLPLASTQHSYPHDTNGPILSGWREGNLYAAVPALALIVTAVGLLFGCTWCYRHKDCKQNEGADNQLFTASATHLHERRSHPPDSGFSEPANNNISEDNNNGPISLREMQNIANNNATAYIVSENEERNRVSRESVVEFEPLPTGIRVADPLERCVDWFGDEDFPRNRLQYLREIGRGWFGRVVEGEIEDEGTTTTVAVKILNQNASLEDKARFLDEARLYRDASHENVLAFVASCLQEDPWVLIFELCSTDLQNYLTANRPKMAALYESGVPLRLMCDVASALSYLHSRGFIYGELCTRNVQIRGVDEAARAVLGNYGLDLRDNVQHTSQPGDVSSLGYVLRDICSWGATPPPAQPDCPYRDHLHQVMQLCWHESAESRPSAAQVQALLEHLHSTHLRSRDTRDDGYGSSDFEERWQRLKPNSIPKLDEHRAIVHAPSTSMTSHFTGSEEYPSHSLSVDMDTAVSRSSSIMSDKDPLSVQIKSESLTNLHGSLEDVRNIYLTHNEQAVLECHQGNTIEDRENDRSDASVDPWLKDIIAGSQDDVSYYKDVSDVIKNLDNILNSEKTSSSESSHQASPSRDNLSLDCKKDYPMQSSMVKSPGITNFQNILEVGYDERSPEKKPDEDEDRDTIGTLSHSFERHSDTTSQHTLENLTPDTPIKDMELPFEQTNADLQNKLHEVESEDVDVDAVLPKESKVDNSNSVKIDICIAPMHSVNEPNNVYVSEDCQTLSDSKFNDKAHDKETVEAKSISDVSDVKPVCNTVEEININKTVQNLQQNVPVNVQDKELLPVLSEIVKNNWVSDLLPNAPLVKKHATDLRPEEIRINSQKEVNNDLISPAESTSDSKITPVDIVALEETSMANFENLDNDSKIAFESPLRLEESKREDSPIPTIKQKGESNIPESVQTKSVTSVRETLPESIYNSDVEIVPLSIKETDFSKKTEIETSTTANVSTPTLILSKAQDDVQWTSNIDKVPEEFIGKIIKEAEIAALNCIENSQAKMLVPEPLNISKNEPIEVFLKDEISSLEISNAVKSINNSESRKELSNKSIPPQENSQHNFLKEEVVIPLADGLDNIAKEILIDALHEVPKAMEKVESPDFFHEKKLEITLNTDIQLQEPHEIGSLGDLNVVRNVPQAVHQPIHDQPMEPKEITDTQIESQSVHPQLSLDLESTASADSSQSTFLIKDTVKEESKQLTENPIEAIVDNTVQEIIIEPKVNAEAVINTFLDPNNGITVNIGTENIQKLLPNLPSQNEQEIIATVAEDNIKEVNADSKSNNTAVENRLMPSDDSTTYMDFTDDVKAKIIDQNPMNDNIKNTINSCLDTSANDSCSLIKHESTEYLDLPTVAREVDEFLHAERQLSSQVDEKDPLCSSTPKSSVDDANSTEEKSNILSETKVPDYGPGVTLTKLEQQCVPDFLSPFDSPTKSHPTDTYDENSSVVLGPFENCTMDVYKAVKSGGDLADIPKEEMFAFSSNFSEMNLETPSPLRDGNFLHEVPDIINDDNFLDIMTDVKDEIDAKTSASDVTDQSVAEKKVSPSTPPNSPGYFLASTSQQKYVVDIDLNQAPEPAPVESDSGLSSLHKEIELNQIELQITSKLAIAENENNLNIEYSGPLTVEGLVQNDLVREEESVPETFLAGNGGNINDIREMFTLDEDCVNALRNELELKLPLAQVAAIEPACESADAWPEAELPPPPELVLSYPGALSPIAEETGPQLSAYENDMLWNASLRTESSESYPSPCNNSTEEPTEPPTGQDTYTLPAPSCTQPQTSSREITMSADSLNTSPTKNAIDDRTFTVDEGPCERISQVSPFVLSPTTDSADTAVTGVSTLSKTTQPTDVKPSETLSKATSIDSWCSNDTLYNVEEAFDDLASDRDVPPDFEPENDNSESDTVTLEDDKELSHVSTYIVHDSESDEDRFSPDSITANDNDNNTYTKAKASPNKSEGSKTKDLAYGTLTGPYSNCTTELLSADNAYMLPPPELVRRSPIDVNIDISATATKECEEVIASPQLKSEPCVRKMDSIEITCLEDNLLDNESPKREEVHDSPHCHYDRAAGLTSTPLSEIPSEESTASTLAAELRTPENLPSIVPNYQSFMLSAELRHQETAQPTFPNESEESEESRIGSDATPSFIEFMQAATSKPQEMSRLQSSQNGSGDFDRFENSMKIRPQDLSNEKVTPKEDSTRPSQPTLVLSPPSITNFKESHVGKNTVIITDLEEDETEQPHSIIIAEISKENDSTNRTFDSHIVEMNHTYDSHTNMMQKESALKEGNSDNSKEITFNGTNVSHDSDHADVKSPEPKTEETNNKEKTVSNVDTLKDIPNGSVSKVNKAYGAKCNGNSEKFATVNFINESFEELLESNVDDADRGIKDDDEVLEKSEEDKLPLRDSAGKSISEDVKRVEEKMVAVTEDFLQNEKNFCQLDSYLPLLSDIRFTGPASEIMSTSFTQDSPTEPAPEGDGDKPGDVKEWDSDTDSHSSNSSSGEFIWKRGSNGSAGRAPPGSDSGSGSGSGSGSEGDEVEFVPSSWDCRAEPAKSSLRSLPISQDNKKRVVFKRQKYHCVYEYPRELATVDADSPAYLPDLSTYTEWDPGSAEEAELGYGQLFGAASPLDLYPLRGTVAFGADYDEDFFISSSARPFESLGVMSTTSQFFPGMRLKPLQLPEHFPPPPSPLAPHAPHAPPARTPELDFTTPDSGVEDITPSSNSADEDFGPRKPDEAGPWRGADGGSSSESASPGSPGDALGGLRHTRDRLKLDLPPSPHLPSPRHGRVFNFVLDKPKRRAANEHSEIGTAPLVMTDETPVVAGSLPVPECEDVPAPEPTFSTFGKTVPRADPEQKIILTDDDEKAASPVKEPVRGEGTVLDSGDEDSGIESSAKATLERKTPNVS